MLRKRISELRSRKTQTPEKQGPLGTPGKQDARPPTASLQEPEGVQVALSAIVSYHLPTHRSGWDEEGPDPPLELAVRRPETRLQSLPSPHSQEAAQQDSRPPLLGGDCFQLKICDLFKLLPPHDPVSPPSSKTPRREGGAPAPDSPLSVPSSGKWDNWAQVRMPGTSSGSLLVNAWSFGVYFQNQPETAEETGGPHLPVSIRAPLVGKRHLSGPKGAPPSHAMGPWNGHATFLRASVFP